MIELEPYMTSVSTSCRRSRTQARVSKRTATPHRSKLESIKGRRSLSKKRASWLVSLLAYLSAFLRAGFDRRSEKTFGERH